MVSILSVSILEAWNDVANFHQLLLEMASQKYAFQSCCDLEILISCFCQVEHRLERGAVTVPAVLGLTCPDTREFTPIDSYTVPCRFMAELSA